MKLYDIALAEEPDGSTLMHAPDCPYVRRLADAGQPVFTLFGCQGELPIDIKRHSCLKPAENAENARSAAK